MTQPRRPDEIALYAALREAAREYRHDDGTPGNGSWGGRKVVIKIISELGIPEGRAFYLLSKWCGKGYIEFGMWVWGGWFVPTAPETLEP